MSDMKITVRENGSLRIEGEIPLADHEGNPLAIPTGKPYALCRCGASSRKPFCDGSHKTIEFDGTLAPE
jgi:CDGSH-type Zn-finger protein